MAVLRDQTGNLKVYAFNCHAGWVREATALALCGGRGGFKMAGGGGPRQPVMSPPVNRPGFPSHCVLSGLVP